MTRSIPITSRPWYLRAPMFAVVLALAAAVLVGGWLAWDRIVTVPDSHVPGMQFTTERGDPSTEGSVNSPLRASMRIPWSNGSPETAIASASIQFLDSDGKPALFGDSARDAQAMKPAMEIGVWVYDGSVPSKPGSYHTHVQIDELNGKSETFDLSQPVLMATAGSGPPLTGGYAFARDANLWLLAADASHEKRLTYYQSYYELAENPAWSPDGKSIAYAYSPKTAPDQVPFTDIWSVGPDGTGARKLVEHGKDESLAEPAWSPDGRSLYFGVQTSSSETTTVDPMGLTAENWRIDKIDLASGKRTTWQPNARMPAAGREMVYIQRVVSPNPDIAVQGLDRLMISGDLSAASAPPRMLVNEKQFQALQDPQLSPNGKWVVFSAINVPPSGSVRPGAVSARSSGDPSAPDAPAPGFDLGAWARVLGHWLGPTVASAHGAPWDLFLVPSTGGAPIRLTTLNEDQPAPVWLDDTTIAAMGTTGLYKLSIDAAGKPAGQPAKLHDGATHGGLTWRRP